MSFASLLDCYWIQSGWLGCSIYDRVGVTCSGRLRVLNVNPVFCTMQVSSITLRLSTSILLLHRMLACLAILLYSPLFRPSLDLGSFRGQASNSTIPTNGLQRDVLCSL